MHTDWRALYGYQIVRPESFVTITMPPYRRESRWLARAKTVADFIEHLSFTAVGLIGVTFFLYLTGAISLAGPAGMLAGFMSFAAWTSRR